VPVLYIIGTFNDISTLDTIRFGLPLLNVGFLTGLFIEAANRRER
jgi:hypothetical protein